MARDHSGLCPTELRVLLACTGSVASVKIPELILRIGAACPTDKNVTVKLVATENSLRFFNVSDLPSSVPCELFRDEDEWRVWKGIGDKVLHIELSKWADVMVIAPLDANTMAKMANGICDNLLTCVARAWNEKPLMFCPAMNTNMWLHPMTSSQVDTLKSWGYFEVPCVEKKLACGDFGLGGMAELDTIVGEIWKRIT